ncbi:amino acid transporter [Aspergillus affinis]|uniref:amino acid transporter n=1 Tax=Aspergillus affinis TaxID=1070780 RepID=UPI0022FE73E5|nr:amino acid transporter [Aspergillus affinis]KAI9035327.1 amino acid transporter [Aspergillus affinis]
MQLKEKQQNHDITEPDPDVPDTQVASKEDIIPITSGELHRRLNYRQVQIMALGGSIGTALFVNIGGPLAKGGPLSLLISFILYSAILACVNNCIAEMSVLHPTPGGFIRMAGKFVDDAFGFMAGWNYFIFEALTVPFEITALMMTLSFWRDDTPAGIVCGVCIALYSILDIFAVRVYGEIELWGSSGKVLLISILFTVTFVVMVDGNPQYDAFGFRYWNNPGPMAEYLSSGSLGRFEGFLGSLWMASFTIVGPDYVTMIAAETQHPRTYVKKAFQMLYWRFGIFFVLAAVSVGILLPYNDPTLIATFITDASSGTKAAGSPFIIAMGNMQISILPDLMNALLVTTIFSVGNSYLFCARSAYILRTSCDMLSPLSLLQLGNGSSQALTWLTNILTTGGLIIYFVMAVTNLFFHRACQAQGVDRTTFPCYGRFQPYSTWVVVIDEGLIILCYGYASFYPWDISTFFTHYTLVILAPILFFFWNCVKRTEIIRPQEADLIWERPIVDSYEATMLPKPRGFWAETLQ